MRGSRCMKQSLTTRRHGDAAAEAAPIAAHTGAGAGHGLEARATGRGGRCRVVPPGNRPGGEGKTRPSTHTRGVARFCTKARNSAQRFLRISIGKWQKKILDLVQTRNTPRAARQNGVVRIQVAVYAEFGIVGHDGGAPGLSVVRGPCRELPVVGLVVRWSVAGTQLRMARGLVVGTDSGESHRFHRWEPDIGEIGGWAQRGGGEPGAWILDGGDDAA